MFSKLFADFPPDWLRTAEVLAGTHVLNVHGRDVRIEVDTSLLSRVVLPVLAGLQRLQHDLSRRVLVGLAGIPGSGKSTFAALLDTVGQRVLPAGRLAVFGLDGWHYPNAELDRRRTTDARGRPVPLRARKGGPESFDVEALAEALDALRADRGDVLLPVYDRRIHDPRPQALRVQAEARILLIEGNYLLLHGEPWRRIGQRLDLKLFLECDPRIARQRVIERHTQGGCTAGQAEEKCRGNDDLNIRLVQTSADRAELAIRLDPPELLPVLDEARPTT